MTTPDPTPQPADGRRGYPPGGPDAALQARLRERLLALRAGLLRSNRDLADEALKGSGQDFSVDHMADQAMEDAIRKIDGYHELPYGACEACVEAGLGDGASPWIPAGRLEAVPYARLCVPHQEAQEEE